MVTLASKSRTFFRISRGAIFAGSLILGAFASPAAAQTVADQSGHERDGTIVGTAVYTASVPAALSRSKASLDVSGGAWIDAVDYHGVTGADPRTVAAWIYPHHLNQQGVIAEWGTLATGQRWTLRLDFTRLRIEVQGGFAMAETELTAGAWNHVAVTFEGTHLNGGAKLFVNGVEQQFSSFTDRAINTSGARNVRLGARWDFYPDSRWFIGAMDDFGIWSRALSPAEIASLAGGSLAGDLSSGLELYYDFEVRSEMPLAADFGGVRFIEFIDGLTYPNGLFELTTLAEGDKVGNAGKIIPDESGNERDGLVDSADGSGTFSPDVPSVLTTSLTSYDMEGHVVIDTLGYKGVTGTTPRTVVAWLNPTSVAAGSDGILFEWGAGITGQKWTVRILDGRVRVEAQGGYVIGEAQLAEGQWNHIAVTFEGVNLSDGLKIFVNGVEQPVFAISDRVVNTAAHWDVRIGARWAFDPRLLEGKIDEVGIWSRALSAAEVAQLAGGAAVPSLATALELYYSFEESVNEVVITSIPAELSGNLAITTANDPTGRPQGDLSPYLGFLVDRATTVYIAYDQNAAVPAWLSNHYNLTGQAVATTAGSFNLWARNLVAHERVALLWDNTTWKSSDNNYFILFNHGPEIITAPADWAFRRSNPGDDFWRLDPHHWTLASGVEVGQHVAEMVTEASNFDSASGFNVSTEIRLPRFEQDGDQSVGLILMGNGDGGIRAEWLPRPAGGNSILRLVDGTTGTILESAPWTGVAPAAINNEIGVSGATAITISAGSSFYAGGETSVLFGAGFEDGGAGWTSGSFNASPDQWEIGSPGAGPGSAFEGQNVAATRLNSHYGPESASWLLSPVIDLTESSEATLRFQEYMDVDTFSLDGDLFHYGAVSIVDVDTEETTLVASYSEDILSWTERSFDIGAYAGRRIQVEFAFFSDNYIADVGPGWYIDAVEVLGSGAIIVAMPKMLSVDGELPGIPTDKDGLGVTSLSALQFTVNDDGEGDGVTVYVAWDETAAGLEPDWLRDNFRLTDHTVGVSVGYGQHRLWGREYQHGDTVTLGGASAAGGGPFPEGTNNYFVLLGDDRAGQETIYTLTAEGIFADGAWNIDFAVSDQAGTTQSITTTVAGDPAWGKEFGLALSHENTVGGGLWSPELWQIFSFSLTAAGGGVPVGFEAWRAEHFPDDLDNAEISGPGASPAGDGVANLMKYALDLDPWVPASSSDLPWLDPDGDELLILVYWERTDINDIDYLPEVSEDLVEWKSGEPFVVTTPGAVIGNRQEFEAVGNVGLDATSGFIRLKVIQKE